MLFWMVKIRKLLTSWQKDYNALGSLGNELISWNIIVYGIICSCTIYEQADGFAAVERVGVAANHRALLCNDAVFELLQKWLGVTVSKPKHMKHSRTSKVMDAVVS